MTYEVPIKMYVGSLSCVLYA